MLGQFRRSYETLRHDLTILPIGQRTVNNSEYAGEVYYFLNLDEKAESRFLTFSDIRPVFYESTANSHRREVHNSLECRCSDESTHEVKNDSQKCQNQ